MIEYTVNYQKYLRKEFLKVKNPIKLVPHVAEIVWGGTRLIENYGVKTDKKNAAEAWVLSCHAAGSSVVSGGEYDGRAFADAVKENPAICGTNAAGFEGFPVLIKFIDACDDLSVQVHPDGEYCKRVGRGESKTECWYILDCDEGAHLVLGFKEKISSDEFKTAIENNTLMEKVEKVPVKKGDFFFIEAGTLHAICKGVLLAEVQQNSNTTYRIYDYNRPGMDGKPRELHVSDAVEVTKCVPYASEYNCKDESLYNGAKKLLTDCPFFKVWELNINGEKFTDNCDETSFVSLLVLEGEGVLVTDGGEMPLAKGESVFLPAGCGTYSLEGKIQFLETRI